MAVTSRCLELAATIRSPSDNDAAQFRPTIRTAPMMDAVDIGRCATRLTASVQIVMLLLHVRHVDLYAPRLLFVPARRTFAPAPCVVAARFPGLVSGVAATAGDGTVTDSAGTASISAGTAGAARGGRRQCSPPPYGFLTGTCAH